MIRIGIIVISFICIQLSVADPQLLNEIEKSHKRIYKENNVSSCSKIVKRNYKYILKNNASVFNNMIAAINHEIKEYTVKKDDCTFLIIESLDGIIWCYLWDLEDSFCYFKDPYENFEEIKKINDTYIARMPEVKMIKLVDKWSNELNEKSVCNGKSTIDGSYVIASRITWIENNWKVESKLFAEFH